MLGGRVGGYAWIAQDQVVWYRQTSQSIAGESGGTPPPGLAFFHIPLPEYDAVWQGGSCEGAGHEAICCPRLNSGLFAALYEMGDVLGTFVGHDHVNDFDGDLHGIRLCHGRATGYATYGRDGFRRGARVLRLYAGMRGFETWLRLAGGSRVSRHPVGEFQKSGRKPAHWRTVLRAGFL